MPEQPELEVPDSASITRTRRDDYVLVVDDDWMNREVIETYLQSAGYRVITVNSGERALEVAASEPPSLVVLDLKMPGMDGFETCRRLKADGRTRFTPVMVITGVDDDDDRRQAIQTGADDFLTKPFNSLVMLTRVRSLLRLYRLQLALDERNAMLNQILARQKSGTIGPPVDGKQAEATATLRDVTVCFAQIRGLDEYATAHTAAEAAHLLSQLNSVLVTTIEKYHGTFDRLIGSATLSFFGAPEANEHDNRRAAQMALAMQTAFQDVLAQHQNAARKLGLSIGLHAGETITGYLGLPSQAPYTIVGDTVEIARYLQDRAPAGYVLISKAVYQPIKEMVEVKPLQPLQIAGRHDPIGVYRLLNVKNQLEDN
ncbi:MAG: response regulator [Chloroflexi bacterium]|nr:response regulator [Chloroflexota bacterium]